MGRPGRGRRDSRPRRWSPRATATKVEDGDQVLAHLWIGNGFTQEEASHTYDEDAKPRAAHGRATTSSPAFNDGARGPDDRLPGRGRGAGRGRVRRDRQRPARHRQRGHGARRRRPRRAACSTSRRAPRRTPRTGCPRDRREGRRARRPRLHRHPGAHRPSCAAPPLDRGRRRRPSRRARPSRSTTSARSTAARSRSTRATRAASRRRSRSAPARSSRAGTRASSACTVGSRVVLAIPPDARLRRGGQPGRGIPAQRHAVLRGRHPRRGLSRRPQPLEDGRSRHDGAARASGCSTCSSCCSSSATTSPRSGSGRSSTRTPRPDAFEKMFERDKEELRSLGVPIEVGSIDAYFDDEPGYRIRPDEFALPDISLDRRRGRGRRPGHPGLAARPARRGHHRGGAQAHRGRASRSTSAALDIVEPRLSADEPAFDVVLGGHPGAHAGRASTTGAPATTEPDDPAPPAVGRRPLLRPLVRRRARHRPRRGAGLPALPGRRATARRTARPASYDVPPGTDLRAIARRLAPAAADRARRPLLVRQGAGAALRRGADRVEAGVAGPDDRQRLGPGRAQPRRARRSPTSCSATAPTSSSRSPPSCATHVVDRLTARRRRAPR